MKKMKMLLLGVLVLALLTGISMAKRNGGGDRDRECDPDSCAYVEFVDADGDGVCDNNCDGCIPDPPKDGEGRKNGRK